MLLALAIFLLSLGATFGAWEVSRQQLKRGWQSEFDFQVRQTVRRIEERMGTYEQVQRGTQAFLLGSVDVKREDFRLFVESLRLPEFFPGIQGIALVKLMSPGQLAGHAAAARQDSVPYALHPAGRRDVYSAITHIEPFTGLNPRALGFDMLTEPNRRRAMERARDTGLAAASGKVRLIQENGKDEQVGLVLYLPVYARGMPRASLQERRAGIIGWVGAPFRMNDLMDSLGGERSGDITLSIYDGDTVADASRLYASRLASATPAHQSLFTAQRQVAIAGRPWTLEIGSAPAFEARIGSGQPALIAGVGIALSAMLALLVWNLASGRRRAISRASDVSHQLSESEYRWKYALEGAGDGVWDWNCATGESVYSTRWKEMLGYEAGDVANAPAEWERMIHPDDAPAVLATLQAYRESAGAAYKAEYRMRCKDGSWKWVLARGMAVTRDAQGRPLRTIGTHADITRSKQDEITLRNANARLAAEQHRFSVILEHSHDAFIAVAPDGRVTDWNAKAEKMFGISAPEAIGHDLAGLIIPEQYRAAHNAGFARFVRTGESTFIRAVVEVTAKHSSGRLVPIELAIAGFPEESGHAVSAFIRDISERKEAQRLEAERSRALEEARNALHHAQKLEAVGKLTGGIAHDFNNVLHVLGGNIQLLQKLYSVDERLQKRLLSMQSAVDRGAKLSSQLLAFARRQPLQPVALNPLRVIRNMDDLLEQALGESVHIRVLADDDLWNTLVDPGQLETVVINLVINARDALATGGVVTIELHNTNIGGDNLLSASELKRGDYVRLTVSDTGCGMSAEVAAAAFEPFFTTKPVGQGTGLGLSMAYGFVKQSGGHIELDSVPGRGTCVIIHLPRSEQVEAPLPRAPADASVGGGETILVVEDDPDVRATAVITLAELGYRVLDAEDGDIALRIVQSGIQIDLLFTDVVMPGAVSSTELATLAKKLSPAISVLFTSGYTRNALTTEGRIDEGVQLLSKPYRREQLAQKVREVLGRTA